MVRVPPHWRERYNAAKRRVVQFRVRLVRIEPDAALLEKRVRLRIVHLGRESPAAGQLPPRVGLDQRKLADRAVELLVRHDERKQQRAHHRRRPAEPAGAFADFEPVNEFLRVHAPDANGGRARPCARIRRPLG